MAVIQLHLEILLKVVDTVAKVIHHQEILAVLVVEDQVAVLVALVLLILEHLNKDILAAQAELLVVQVVVAAALVLLVAYGAVMAEALVVMEKQRLVEILVFHQLMEHLDHLVEDGLQAAVAAVRGVLDMEAGVDLPVQVAAVEELGVVLVRLLALMVK
tara:strand:+ start:481 stop:957 length:477 start_codon:yes stop_codon:yes gene_type:complete